MTAFNIYSAIGGVVEDILEESEIVPNKKNTKIIPIAAAAACLAVFAVGLSHTLRTDNIQQPVTGTTVPAITFETRTETDSGEAVTGGNTGTYVTPVTPPNEVTDSNAPTETAEMFTEPYPAVTEETTVCPTETAVFTIDDEEMVIVPKWEDLSDLERYIYLEYAGNEYSITIEHFDESKLTFLRNGEIFGIDEYTNERYGIDCAVYKIENISPEYMVAVLTADSKYTGFKRERFWFDTLGEAVEGTGILKRNIIGDMVTISDDSARQTTVYTVPDLQQAAEKLLNSAPDTAVHVNPPSDSGLISYRIYDKNGRDGKSVLQVYPTGYVYFGASYFNPGAEYAEEFIEYVKGNAVSVEVIPYDAPDPNEVTVPE